MATWSRSSPGESRRGVPSPKPKGRENAKDTLCKNVTIYGHCRYEGKGCAFNHDPAKVHGNHAHMENAKKRLNVDSPTFTPSTLPSNGVANKTTSISPNTANAVPFIPKGSNSGTTTPSHQPDPAAAEWTPEVQEFLPQNFDTSQMGEPMTPNSNINPYDSYSTPTSTFGQTASLANQAQINPYAQDPSAMGNPAFFPSQGAYAQPLQYHLYAPLGPHKENLLAYQRTAHDFFVTDSIREELQRKAEATLQVLPNSTLPSHIDHFHTLVPLDTSNQKNATVFGYPSWVYKAVSNKDGNVYALRRLEGYRLTNEKAIRSVQSWKRVSNGSVVTVHDAFTTRAFGDSSLIFVTDYHPLSKTLAEHHFQMPGRFQARPNAPHVPEQVLWGYMVQIANALKTIHGTGLAARLIEPSKILLTSQNRIRLNACAILDVVQFDAQANMAQLQQEDLAQFGRLILSLANNSAAALHNLPKAMDHMARSYTAQLKDCVFWLLGSSTPNSNRDIDHFINGISGHVIATLDKTLHLDDQLTTELSRELESARLFRLMAKLNFINERPEFQHDQHWSETGERYFLKLFRDYVFHQVDAQGNPVIDLGHVLTCLNKLDAGVEEKVMLVSRDEQNCIVVSYREVKRAVEAAFQDLLKASRRGH